jgi:hypothetical protein
MMSNQFKLPVKNAEADVSELKPPEAASSAATLPNGSDLHRLSPPAPDCTQSSVNKAEAVAQVPSFHLLSSESTRQSWAPSIQPGDSCNTIKKLLLEMMISRTQKMLSHLMKSIPNARNLHSYTMPTESQGLCRDK